MSLARRGFLILLAVFVALVLIFPATEAAEGNVVMYFFWSEGCPYCAREKPFLESLKVKYPSLVVIKKEISSSRENVKLLQKMGEEYGRNVRGVPTTFLGDRVWVGYEDKIGEEIEEGVQQCVVGSCVNPMVKLKGESEVQEKAAENTNQSLDVPFFGTVKLNSMSSYLSTALIAFVDGFNPCSLWVLTFLLGLLIYTKSRKKIIIVGSTFLLITAGTYGLFILGLFSAFQYIGQIIWIRALVALIAFSFGLVNVKDYFWFQEGISFSIPGWVKPKIAEKFRNLTQKSHSLPALVGATGLMALGVTLAELPCTAGFPVVWTGILNSQDVSNSTFAILFVLYMVIYLLDELLVFMTVSITLESSRIREEHGRLLKLVGGTLMLSLAASFLFAPELMNGLLGSLVVFGAALLGSALLVLLRRVALSAFKSEG